MSCVKCRAWVLTEKEASAACPAASPRDVTQSTDATAAATVQSHDLGPIPSHKATSIMPPSQISNQTIREVQLETEKGTGHARFLPPDLGSALKEALLQKLWEARALLANTSVRGITMIPMIDTKLMSLVSPPPRLISQRLFGEQQE